MTTNTELFIIVVMVYYLYERPQCCRSIFHLNNLGIFQNVPPLPVSMVGSYEKLGIGFEAKVKKGSLLVLSVDTQKNINERPATQQLLESIDRYVKSDKFAPQITVDESYIESFLKK